MRRASRPPIAGWIDWSAKRMCTCSGHKAAHTGISSPKNILRNRIFDLKRPPTANVHPSPYEWSGGGECVCLLSNCHAFHADLRDVSLTAAEPAAQAFKARTFQSSQGQYRLSSYRTRRKYSLSPEKAIRACRLHKRYENQLSSLTV